MLYSNKRFLNKNIFVTLLCSFGLSTLGMLIAVWLKFENQIIGLIIQDILFIVAILLFFKREKIQPQDIGWKKTPLLSSLWFALRIWFPTMIGVGIIGYYASNIPGFQAQPSYQSLFGDTLLTHVIFIILAAIVAPIIEESMFRGILLPWMMQYLKAPYAIILNGIVFGVLHLQFQSAIPLSIIGIALAFIAYRKKSLLPSILFHAINNSIAIIALLYSST